MVSSSRRAAYAAVTVPFCLLATMMGCSHGAAPTSNGLAAEPAASQSMANASAMKTEEAAPAADDAKKDLGRDRRAPHGGDTSASQPMPTGNAIARPSTPGASLDGADHAGAGRGGGAAGSMNVNGPYPSAADKSGLFGPGSRGGGTSGAVAAAPVLDPNARYATTYRPGGAALAAFDAAVARGALPANSRDLVGDFGGRYAPTLSVPAGSAMAFTTTLERGLASPAGGPMHLRIAMKGADVAPARAPLSVHLVLDVSGSMDGPAIENAKDAAKKLVERLAPTDDFSMVTFSSDARVLIADGPVGPRRATILGEIGRVRAMGGTNISAGLDLGYAQAHTATIASDAVRIVMLLSDGHANGGDSSLDGLQRRSERAFSDGIQTSTFGLGADFDAKLMSGIADRGSGGYYYLADSTQIADALGRELDARLVPVATGVEVRVRLSPDVHATRVYGSHVLGADEARAVRAQELSVDELEKNRSKIAKDREHDTEGGMRFFMPAFARGDRHAMLLSLNLPKGVGERSIGSLEIRMKDRVSGQNVTLELPLRAAYAKSDAESAASTDRSVAATVQAFAAGDAILAAADRVDMSDRLTAASLLSERAGLLRAAAKTLGEPMLDDDARRFDRLVGAVNGEHMIEDGLQLAVLLRGSGHEYLR
jgi:Ca-activated chloride channel family protein